MTAFRSLSNLGFASTGAGYQSARSPVQFIDRKKKINELWENFASQNKKERDLNAVNGHYMWTL